MLLHRLFSFLPEKLRNMLLLFMQEVRVLSYSNSFQELCWSNFGGTWWFQWLKPEELICIGFSWQGDGRRETSALVLVRKEKDLLRCWTEQAPAGSKTDPTAAQSWHSSTSGWHLCDDMFIIELKMIHSNSERKDWEKLDTQSIGLWWCRFSPCSSAGFPSAAHWGADIHVEERGGHLSWFDLASSLCRCFLAFSSPTPLSVAWRGESGEC